MKLINFVVEDVAFFGLAVDGFACSFDALHASLHKTVPPELASVNGYLRGLPHSFEQALHLQDHARARVRADRTDGLFRLEHVRMLPAVPQPAALIDFGLTPKHLVNSAKTLLRYEFGPFFGAIAARFVTRGILRKSRSPILQYYKGNHLAIIGDGDEMGWPSYTSYLDIEPELAFVTGGTSQPIAGYLVYNDISARDVQFPEMIGTGPARAKDFVGGNGFGPFLVTPDEVPDPLNLRVSVNVGSRFAWEGTTAEHTHHPDEVVAFLHTVYPQVPGIVVGMGTIPGCAGLDNDLWIRPGERIEISIEHLGTLRQHVPATLPPLEPSRWKARGDLQAAGAEADTPIRPIADTIL